MNRLFLILLSLAILSSCKQTATETASDPAADTLKKETAVSKDTVQVSAPVTELSGKAAQISGKWKATEFEVPSIKLSGELINIRFTFKNDMTFEYFEDGKKDGGSWKLSDKEDQILLTYSNTTSTLNIKELKENKLVLAGKEHGMYRTYTLEKSK